MSKAVCIIGAGPSGLVAAKTLLYNAPSGLFKVTIYEAQKRIGGLWPSREDDTHGLIHPLMVTNLSRHTQQFSDLAWGHDEPQFPRAWMVGRYLERYLDAYPGAEVKLGHRVTKTELQADGCWAVSATPDCGAQEETRVFDHLIVASGFFGTPHYPNSFEQNSAIPVRHSSGYRGLHDLLGEFPNPGDKIVVVGGQLSGVETASNIATDLACTINSATSTSNAGVESYRVHHLIQRPTWVFPLFTSPNPKDAAPSFLPMDVQFANVGGRPRPVTDSRGHISKETAREKHSANLGILGTDQAEYDPQLAMRDDALDTPPYLAISQRYLEFVRCGSIKVSHGYFQNLEDCVMVTSSSSIPGVAAVVFATGFDPSPQISFLPGTVLKTLQYSASDHRLPLALSFHDVHHPDLPSLGFVGLFRGPYWGTMEMQARLLTALWTPETLTRQRLRLFKTLGGNRCVERTLALRGDVRASQFPSSDVLFIAQEVAAVLGMELTEPPAMTLSGILPNVGSMDIVTPARYVSPLASAAAVEESQKSIQQTHSMVVDAVAGSRFVAGAVFRSLLGTWRLERDVTSKLPSHPSGHFSGTARFLLRQATSDGLQCSTPDAAASAPRDNSDLEYLYVEDGKFQADNGMAFQATRRYIWRYDETMDRLSVWFVKPDDGKTADYLFHNIDFLPRAPAPDSPSGWKAKAGHLCDEDFYDVRYEFSFRAVNLKEWNIAYAVRGPKKDYTIHGAYTR